MVLMERLPRNLFGILDCCSRRSVSDACLCRGMRSAALRTAKRLQLHRAKLVE